MPEYSDRSLCGKLSGPPSHCCAPVDSLVLARSRRPQNRKQSNLLKPVARALVVGEMAMLQQLEPDTRLVPFNEGKEPLRNWLRVLIVSIVTLSELLQSLLIIRGHNRLD